MWAHLRVEGEHARRAKGVVLFGSQEVITKVVRHIQAGVGRGVVERVELLKVARNLELLVDDLVGEKGYLKGHCLVVRYRT